MGMSSEPGKERKWWKKRKEAVAVPLFFVLPQKKITKRNQYRIAAQTSPLYECSLGHSRLCFGYCFLSRIFTEFASEIACPKS
jgi:hypothetical protein